MSERVAAVKQCRRMLATHDAALRELWNYYVHLPLQGAPVKCETEHELLS